MAVGAGVQLGLNVMLFADIGKYYLPSSYFEGFKVLVHHPEDYPAVKEKGFAVGPGTETFIAVDAQGVKLTFFESFTYK